MKSEAAVKALPAVTESRLAIDKIKVTANVRKHFDEGRMKELAENIGKVGILEPLLVRANGDGYHLIAGERRLRAAKMAKLDQVPVRILDVDEKQAAEIQAFENLHREDLTPIEEARAFKLLLDAGGHTVESLAERVDKSVRHVYRAIALLQLSASIQELLESDALTPAHGYELLRAPEKQRERFAKWSVRDKATARDLREQVELELGQDLTKVDFPKDRPFGGMPACVGCPFNSDNQLDLLGETIKGRCTGKDCFETKSDAFVSFYINEQREKLPGVKFGRTVEQSYQAKTPAGMIQLPASATVIAQVRKNPKAFVATVVKRKEYSDPNPGLIFFGRGTKEIRKAAGMMPSASSGSGSAPAGERPSRIKAIEELTEAAIRKEIWEKTPKALPASMILKMIEADADEICQILQVTPADFEKFNQEQMLKALCFAYYFCGWDAADSMAGVKVDTKAITKRVKEAAEKVWPKSQSPSCKACGCTPMKACQMSKGGWQPCWWVMPGLCSACQAKGKTLESALETADKKPAKK